MTTQTLSGFRQTIAGLLRTELRPAARTAKIPASAPAPEKALTEQPERKTVDGAFLNILLLAMFSNASRMDSFGNFR
ncbi:MAG: hypothetical protein HZB26_20430 [Candidatus Hydrogenedentes bacterium]|nr:hypothetical protein [Candidatus Hydrogenedentota bacterium]